MQKQSWTAEDMALLQTLWAAGETAAAIAGRLGGGMSRSAVLGKVFRLRLRTENDVTARAVAKSPPPMGGVMLVLARRRRRPRRKQPQPVPAPCSKYKTLLELTNNTCRWPHGRPGAGKFFFCGAPEADLERGMPYCERHMRRAYPGFAGMATTGFDGARGRMSPLAMGI
jgi:GcrA cell cycle regulator